jgi:hypothetical protein
MVSAGVVGDAFERFGDSLIQAGKRRISSKKRTRFSKARRSTTSPVSAEERGGFAPIQWLEGGLDAEARPLADV